MTTPAEASSLSWSEIIAHVVGIGGFALTLWQLRKTKQAAIAAKDAAADAISAIRRLEAATKMQDICQRSRELLRLLKGKGSLQTAAQAAFELRDSMAKYRHDSESQGVVHGETWTRALNDARDIHQRLETLSTTRNSAEDRIVLIHQVATLHTQFTSLATIAIVSEPKNANTK